MTPQVQKNMFVNETDHLTDNGTNFLNRHNQVRGQRNEYQTGHSGISGSQ